MTQIAGTQTTATPTSTATPVPTATPTPTSTPAASRQDSVRLGGPSPTPTLSVAAQAHGSDVARMSTVDKLQSALNGGLGIAAKDAGNSALAALKDPKTVALVGAGVAAAVGVQFIPVVGEAVDVVAGVVGVAMYAAAGPEHRKEIGEALGELKAYFQTAHDAKNQHDLDAAAGHFAKFLEKGGKEGVDALLTVGGAVAAPAKFAKLLTEVKGLGSLSDVIRLGERGGAALSAAAGRAKELAGEAAGLLGRGATAVKDAIAAAPGTIADLGRSLGHTAQDAWNATSHFFGEIGDALSPQHAVTPEGLRIPVPRARPEPVGPNVAEMRAQGPRSSGRPGSPSGADLREAERGSVAVGRAARDLVPAERTLANGVKVARGIDGSEKQLVELRSFADYERVAKAKPQPNTIYKFDGKFYETDAASRPIASSGRLSLTKNELPPGRTDYRLATADKQIGRKAGVGGDVGFHHGGDQFGFGGGSLNLSPGSGVLNGGDYKNFEMYLRRQLDANHEVTAQFRPVFAGRNASGVRPNGYAVEFSIDGGPVQERFFFNPRVPQNR